MLRQLTFSTDYVHITREAATSAVILTVSLGVLLGLLHTVYQYVVSVDSSNCGPNLFPIIQNEGKRDSNEYHHAPIELQVRYSLAVSV